MDCLPNYDDQKYPKLRWGYNDLNRDGIPDTLITKWNGKTVAFVSDNGRLPWGAEEEYRDWNEYFNLVFDVGLEPPVMWNERRAGWGSYTLLVDRDECGRFDSSGDWYYRCMDLNGDGFPEAEFYHLFPGVHLFSNKLHVNFNGERDMSFLDFKNFYYGQPTEQRYLAGGKYIMNVHGSGLFLNSYSRYVQTAWETPIAWYDFDFDGRTNMVMRAGDVPSDCPPAERIYPGYINEYEIAFELNSNTSTKRWHSLDMQLTYYNYNGTGLDYKPYIDHLPKIRGLKEAEFLSEKLASTRLETRRQYLPYMDGHKIASEFEGWKGVFLLFDEDDDDNRWEEMFARYEPHWGPYSDRIGDRFEDDRDFGGCGKLYVGRFDGRIHLYHAEFAVWDVDYLALYKGSCDRQDTDEGPKPPRGLWYPRICYSDTTGNGFIDRIEYLTVSFGDEDRTFKIEKEILLSDYADEECSHPDVCKLVDVRVDVPLTGWTIGGWNGNPLNPGDFEGTPCKAIYDKIYNLYTNLSERMWATACQLHQTAAKLGLNKSENLDQGLKEQYTRQELAELKTIEVPRGYSRHLRAGDRRAKYHNGYWLREKVFADILEYSGLDKFRLEKFYYTGRYNRLCEYILSGGTS